LTRAKFANYWGSEKGEAMIRRNSLNGRLPTRVERKYSLAIGVALLSLLALPSLTMAQIKTIVDEWAAVQPPKAPELKSVTPDPKTTALLSLDFVKQTCNTERRPRCLSSIPKVKMLLDHSRSQGYLVVHSIITTATPADVLPDVAPRDGEPIIKAPADKFFRTDLEKILSDKGIKTVIVVGTAAQGAVLNTASQAAFRGLQVIVPVDGMSAENTYFEQYTAYHLANAPGVGQQVTLTRIDMIK
jgi:nicotinamidase-related amidase